MMLFLLIRYFYISPVTIDEKSAPAAPAGKLQTIWESSHYPYSRNVESVQIRMLPVRCKAVD
jgi:hypothetical protein